MSSCCYELKFVSHQLNAKIGAQIASEHSQNAQREGWLPTRRGGTDEPGLTTDSGRFSRPLLVIHTRRSGSGAAKVNIVGWDTQQ